MNEKERKLNKDTKKISSISKMKEIFKKLKLNELNKNITNNKINIQKRFIFENTKDTSKFGSLNTYIKTLKKNNTQIFKEKNTLPKLNSHNNSNSNISRNKIKSFSPILNNDSFLKIPSLKNSIYPKLFKNSRRQPIKIKFYSKTAHSTQNQNTNISNNFKGLFSQKVQCFRKKNNLDNFISSNSSNNKEEINEIKNSSKNENSKSTKNKKKNRKKTKNNIKAFKFSEFYKLSKNSFVSARNIYEHYILEEKEDKSPDAKMNVTKYILKKNKKPKKLFKSIYGFNRNNARRIRELKSNKTIALKPDFNLEEYQDILCTMIKNRCDNNSMLYLQQKYERFNEKLKSYKRNFIYRGRYTKLGDTIRKNIPNYLYVRLKELDKENLISKAKYFNVDINKCQEDQLLNNNI